MTIWIYIGRHYIFMCVCVCVYIKSDQVWIEFYRISFRHVIHFNGFASNEWRDWNGNDIDVSLLLFCGILEGRESGKCVRERVRENEAKKSEIEQAKKTVRGPYENEMHPLMISTVDCLQCVSEWVCVCVCIPNHIVWLMTTYSHCSAP